MKKTNLKEKTLYEFNASQDVVKLQTKYSLFKRVINIITYAKCEKQFNLDLMKKAINLMIARNDCMRIRFTKDKGKDKQYFIPEYQVKDIPYIEFNNQTQEDKFISRFKKKAVKYMKGEIFKIIFIRTSDKKYMILMKVCHLVLDMYGINIIYKDLFEIYDALVNNKELPEAPTKFEDVLKKDLTMEHNETLFTKNKEFFEEYLKIRERPYYAGIHGDKLPLWQKQLKKGRSSFPMFFVNNDTCGYMHNIDKKIVEKVIEYTQKNNYTMANFFFYCALITASLMNSKIKHMMPLELCNCRGTITEKRAAGTKVQSSGCYTTVEYSKSFDENFKEFSMNQNLLYRHIGFPDTEYEMMFNKLYKSSFLETYYSITFSFIPYMNPEGIEIGVISNGKGALPAYIAQMYDLKNGDIKMIYDVQTKIITSDDVRRFHKNYISVIEQILSNSNTVGITIKCLDDLKLLYN